MIKILPIFLLVLFSKYTFSQNETVKYLDANFDIVKEKEAKVFDAVITKMEEGYYAKIYYENNKIAMEGNFYDKKLTIKNGIFTFNYRTNSILAKGNYEYDIQHGVWQKWHENGQKKDSGKLYYGKKVGLWKYWYKSGQLETASKYVDSFATPIEITRGYKQNTKSTIIFNYLNEYFDEVKTGLWITYYPNGQIRDSSYYKENIKMGIAKTWYENGILESEGNYQNDLEDGVWNWYYPNGNTATEEEYKEGKVTDMKCYDSTGKFTSDYCSLNKPPMYPGGVSKFEEFVYNNLVYPPNEGLDKQGTVVKCVFTLDKNGKYNNCVFSNPNLTNFNEQVIAVLKKMPIWEPAIIHNRIIDYGVTLNVVFYKRNNPKNE